jgi:hypothetical protein
MSNSSGTNSDLPAPTVRGTEVVWIESVRSATVFVRAGAARVTPPVTVIGTGGAKKPLTTVIVPLIVAFGVAVAVNVRGEPWSDPAEADTVWLPAKRPRVHWIVATPSVPVWDVGADSVPPPVTTDQLTVTPDTPFPYVSETRLLGETGSAVAAGAVWLSPLEMTSWVAGPGVAVAVKLSGDPLAPASEAWAVWLPAVVPSVQVTEDCAWSFVGTDCADTAPLPGTATQATATPVIPFPYWSRTATTSGCPTLWATWAVWALPETATSCDAAAGMAVAVNVTGDPASPLTLAVAVLLFVPAVVPIVQVTDACPLASVVDVVADRVPPPAVVTHETATPGTPAPAEVVTRATSGWASAWPTVPVWALPDAKAIADGTGWEGPAPSPPQRVIVSDRNRARKARRDAIRCVMVSSDRWTDHRPPSA